MIEYKNNYNYKKISNDLYPFFFKAQYKLSEIFNSNKIKEYHHVISLILTNIIFTDLSDELKLDNNYLILDSKLKFGRKTLFLIDKTSNTFLIFLTQNNFDNMYKHHNSREYLSDIISIVKNIKKRNYLFDEEFNINMNIAELLYKLKINIDNDDNIANYIEKVGIITYGYDKVDSILVDYNFVIPYSANDMSQSATICLLNLIDDKNSNDKETEKSYSSENTGHKVNGRFTRMKTDEEIENERKNDSEEDDNISFVSLK
ncbi:hypothetical protein [Brachyspira innocens]|uniref:hypothetical protein n=1 Tax=Brachyspira innocens TaxID=13264 RepID=UPI0026EC1316|nr:hypothetical protein [Brachyspira innocens]